MSIEAMKKALEALETKGEHHVRVYSAIATLRQAIEQAEKQEPVAAEQDRCVQIIENYQIPVGGSAAGEIACEMTYAALRDIRDQIRGRTESTLQEISDIGQEIEQEPVAWMGVSDNPYCNDSDCNDPNGRAMRWHNKLLELRKQVALDGLAETSREIEQEPVAWWNGQGYNFGADDEDFIYPATRQNHIKAGSPADYWSIPLYTAPPKREWVDLDDNDIQDTEHFCGDVFEFARAIGAKLRERNT